MVRGVLLAWLLNLLLFVPLTIIHGDGSDKSWMLQWAPADALFTLVVCWLFACRKYRRPLREGWGLTPVRSWLLGLAAALGAGCAIGVVALIEAGVGKGQNPMTEMVSGLAERRAGGLYMLAIAVLVPVAEEIYYRSFIFPALATRAGKGVAITAVTLWFAGAHVPQLWGDWAAMTFIAGMSFLFTGLRAATGSTVPSLVAHVAYNVTLTLPLARWSLSRVLG